MKTLEMNNQTINRSSTSIKGAWWKAFTCIWMTLTILSVFLVVGPVLNKAGQPFYTMAGHGAKIIFFPVPCAWIGCMTYIIGACYAIGYLGARAASDRDRMQRNDLKGAAAMELGLLFSFLATTTGMIFAKNEWGAYWNWDPRQTSILVIMFLFAAYIAQRGIVTDPDLRSRTSSVFTLIAVIPGIFLFFILPRIVPETLHEGPNQALLGRQITGNYMYTMYLLALPAFIILFIWMFQLRYRQMVLEAKRALKLAQ